REGVEVVAPEVGELVTSLDMAGCSLTLTWLDEELERLWLAPVDTPAYRKGSVQIADTDESEEDVLLPGSASESSVEIVSVEGRRTARCAARVLRSVAEVLRGNRARRTQLLVVRGARCGARRPTARGPRGRPTPPRPPWPLPARPLLLPGARAPGGRAHRRTPGSTRSTWLPRRTPRPLRRVRRLPGCAARHRPPPRTSPAPDRPESCPSTAR